MHGADFEALKRRVICGLSKPKLFAEHALGSPSVLSGARLKLALDAPAFFADGDAAAALTLKVYISKPLHDGHCIPGQNLIARCGRGWRAARKALFPFTPPARTGERGNTSSEHYFFSEHCWTRLFRRNDQAVTARVPNRLFYTGHMSFGASIQLSARSVLSYLFGSAGKIYVLRAQLPQ